MTCSGSTVEINEFLGTLFKGALTVYDNLDMSLTYNIAVNFTPAMLSALGYFDLLPRPAGVAIDSVEINTGFSWGFGKFHDAFDHSNFFSEE